MAPQTVLPPAESPESVAPPSPARALPEAAGGRGHEGLEREFDALESKFEAAVAELKTLRGRFKDVRDARDSAMQRAWADLDHKWFTGVLASATFFFILSFYVYSLLGQRLDHRPLPPGSDPVFSLLPVVNTVPLLAYGWLLVHVTAWVTWVVYEPRRIPYFLGTIGLFVLVRTLFVALNPVGAPPGMINLNASYLFAPLRGVLAFDNEFFFSGHTAMPYLYALFCPYPWYRRFFLAAAVVMGAAVLLSRNHYTIDVLGAFFMTYGIFALSRKLLGFLDPTE